MRDRLIKLTWLLALIAVAGLVVWAFMPQPVQVETATVAFKSFRKTIDEDGKTRVRERYVVSAPLAGRLGRVTLKPGAAVQRGTLLATLAPSASTLLDERTASELTERVGAAEAEQLRASAGVERASVALDQANAELARAAQLAAKGFTSKESFERSEREAALKAKELKVAQFDAHAAEHRLAQARASLSRARQGVSGPDKAQHWEIRSPVAGKVLRVLQESETVVPTGAPILELGDPADLEVVVDVLTADAVAIRPGAEVALHHADGARPLSGRVRLIEPAAFTKVSALGVEEQRLNVVIDFASPHEQWQNLGDAYRIDARIVVVERERALTVPVGALFRRDDGWAVFVLGDGRARLRSIALGPRNNEHAVVDRGLEAGDTVIVYPGDAVSDGARVKLRNAGA
jgi:HlyD family secretion protein